MTSHEIRTEMIEANGLTFEVHICGDGDKLAICLHGFPEHAISWRYQMPLLADMGYTAWAPNQRGYGKSSKPLGIENYAMEHLMADVGALMDVSGRKDILLMGHDWGAAVAWRFAINQIRPLEKLVICNVPHPACFARELGSGMRQKLKSWYILFFQIPWLPEFILGRNHAAAVGRTIVNMAEDKSKFPEEIIDIYRDNASEPGALTAMINWYRAAVRGRSTAPDETPVIETPTLFIWGEADKALSKETTYGTDEYVRDLTLRYLPGVSHWVQQEAPEAVNLIIGKWLKDESIPPLTQQGQEIELH